MAMRSPRSVADFKGDGQALVADFFSAWNRELPDPLAARNEEILDGFTSKHGRTRFATLFKLNATQADSIVEAAFVESESGEGWRETIEELAGFKFQKPVAPDNAGRFSADRTLCGNSPGLMSTPKPMNVSARLAIEGNLASQVLPEGCFSVIDTADPMNEFITEAELQAFTFEVAAYIASHFGDWHVGRAIARVYGKQAKQRLPNLPDRGACIGRKRDIGRMIQNKCKNRLYVSNAQSNEPQSSSDVACTQRAEEIQIAPHREHR